ncbi:hypothetical protein BCV69DRAFT_283981 [Microstroma glucosiphilum]|uniref:RTA1-domain-containing protein n=1 Tax=Pseudomicrostroma glucosiphilum TaxID=1684307 RepID=A0A316U3K9_9BASI|nr:hypothetical protein BCV69DRAFT_283981 [Pseudomicrostroma glucosiphilum]PWN19879.1 hypothetical protein BCV69DRAFT_283981 [Pseudomicrostroma glucosiphilum]
MRRSNARLAATSLFVLFCLLPSASADDVQLQPDSALAYVPSLGGNAAVTAVYGILCLLLFFWTFKNRAWWALCEPIGAAFSCLGYGLRLLLRQNSQQGSRAVFIPMYLFVILSPAAFLAFNYILGGRLIVAVTAMTPANAQDVSLVRGPENAKRVGCCGSRKAKPSPSTPTRKGLSQRSPLSMIPPRLYTLIFVLSDVLTFLIQAAGGAMQTSNDYASIKTGGNIFLAGVILQTVSYLFFFSVILQAHWKLYKCDPERYSMVKGIKRREPAITVLVTLYVTGILIIIRSLFRVVENGQGYNGTLYTHEIYSFTLDALPLLLVLAVYVLLWPSRPLSRVEPSDAVVHYLQAMSRGKTSSTSSIEMSQANRDGL